MSGYPRITQQIFASSAGTNGIETFGSKAAGSPVYTTDPSAVQTTRYLQGWLGATLAGTRLLPVYQDMNAIHFLFSSQLAYLLERGIPEYDAGTTYYSTDIVRQSGTTKLYASATDSNIGNSLTNPTYWTSLGDLQYTPRVAQTSANTVSTIPVRNANGNFAVNAVNQAVTSTATAAGTTTLTVASSPNQIFTGTTTQTVVLPDATTLVNGHEFFIMNNSTGKITVNYNGGSLAQVIYPLSTARIICTSNATSAGIWAINSGTNSMLGFKAYRSGTQTIAAGTATQVQLNAIMFDTTTWFDTSAYKFLPLRAGYYQFNASVVTQKTGKQPTLVDCHLQKNGSDYSYNDFIVSNSGAPSAGNFTSSSISDIMYLNGTTDYVTLITTITYADGTAPDIIGNSVDTFLSGVFLGS